MKIFIRPSNPDIKIRHPFTGQHVPAGGQMVEASTYWTRRILDGDLVEDRPATATETPAQPSGKKLKKDWNT